MPGIDRSGLPFTLASEQRLTLRNRVSVDADEAVPENFRPFPTTTPRVFPRKEPEQLKAARARRPRKALSELAINRKQFSVRLSEEGWRLADAMQAHYGVSGTALVELLLREQYRTINRKKESLIGREALLDLLARAGSSVEEND